MKIIKDKIKVIIIVSMISVAFTMVIYKIFHQENIQSIDIEYNITYSKKIGYNVDSSSLNFGILMPGTSAEKVLKIKSDYDSFINLSVENVLYVKPESNYIIVNKDIPYNLRVFAVIPENASEGHYKGSLNVISNRL